MIWTDRESTSSVLPVARAARTRQASTGSCSNLRARAKKGWAGGGGPTSGTPHEKAAASHGTAVEEAGLGRPRAGPRPPPAAIPPPAPAATRTKCSAVWQCSGSTSAHSSSFSRHLGPPFCRPPSTAASAAPADEPPPGARTATSTRIASNPSPIRLARLSEPVNQLAAQDGACRVPQGEGEGRRAGGRGRRGGGRVCPVGGHVSGWRREFCGDLEDELKSLSHESHALGVITVNHSLELPQSERAPLVRVVGADPRGGCGGRRVRRCAGAHRPAIQAEAVE
eukprot:scaffold869_cov105-Isochrysis_galbana.AAC.9